MTANVPLGTEDDIHGYVDPALLTLDGAVSTPKSMDSNEWSLIEDSGSARSPSIVNSPSTLSGFSPYPGSPAGGPSDVDFAHPGMDQYSMTASQSPTGPVDAPGDTMHDMAAMAATGHHGAAEVPLVPIPMMANEMAALQSAYCETLDEMHFDVTQVGDGIYPHAHGFAVSHIEGVSLQSHHDQLEGEGYMYGEVGLDQESASNFTFAQQSLIEQQSFVQHPLFIHQDPLMEAPYNQQPTTATLNTANTSETVMVPIGPMNGAWPSPSQHSPIASLIPAHSHSHNSLSIRSTPSQSSPTSRPGAQIPSPASHVAFTPSPFPSSPTRSSSSAPSPSPSTSTSSSSGRKNSKLKPCKASPECTYMGESKELKKHYRTTHKKYAKDNGLTLDPVVCPACGSEFAAGRSDYLGRHQKRKFDEATGEERPSACENKLALLGKGKKKGKM
ncbi:hypothetical protein B0T20DRAFT_389340 [Sordaria brevicollis]|uniref:Uncharacterized protein n=1 Tax=Sordaria brevicollis TaxID=83679 RepID=A0AAE0UEL0_SORBR|nr:hypothetical protein B0T20DRAFT_389340 [Sordaria brevicollis]